MKENMNRRTFVTQGCACGALLLYTGPGHTQTAPLEDLAQFPQTTLTIGSGSAKHLFTIWVADTPAREEQGLMFVRELPPPML